MSKRPELPEGAYSDYNIKPAIYDLRYDPKSKQYYIEHSIDFFKSPPKLYGRNRKHAHIIWYNFKLEKGSMGALLTGQKGAGKTETALLVCNKAISAGMAVICISEIEASIELIHYLKNLSNVVLLFDEFAKNFNRGLQDKMLTMLTDIKDSRKLFMLTENSTRGISDLIKDRPGRAFFHFEYGRMEKEDITEYCQDHGISNSFHNSILKAYEKSTIFTIDYIIALAKLHKRMPELTFDDVLEVINLKILKKKEMLNIIKCSTIEIKDGKEEIVDVNIRRSNPLSLRDFEEGRSMWISLDRDHLSITQKDVVSLDEEQGIIIVNAQKYTFVISIDV